MKIKHETRTTTFVAKRRLNINNTIIEQDEVYATITHPARVPASKVIAGLYNGVAADLREKPGPVDEKPAPDGGGGGVNASPAAIELAAEHGIDLSTVEGSRQDGKITKPDVEKLINA